MHVNLMEGPYQKKKKKKVKFNWINSIPSPHQPHTRTCNAIRTKTRLINQLYLCIISPLFFFFKEKEKEKKDLGLLVV